MMGSILPDAAAMVVKATNCILLQRQESASSGQVMPCIRCGTCASACPMRLLPQQLYWHSRGRNFEQLERYDLSSCIECGCCAVVCPSHIPLVGYFRFAKSEIREHEYKRQRANEMRTRNEARQLRLEMLKQEQEARRKQRKSKRGKRGKTAPVAADTQEAGDKSSEAVNA
jgi:electron transport complex protein RnfC